MITIKEIHIESANGKSRLSGLIEIDGDSHCLWVSVDEKYEKYLCAERCDGFVLGLLHYAMQHGHDICSEVPMTDRLYSQLTEQFLPAFSKINQFQRNKKSFSSGWDVRIFAPLASEVEHPACGEAIGTGCSCGVDSMHVYLEHPEITHSCVWNVHGVSNDETTEKREIGWHNIVSQATKFSKEVGTDILIADSNFDRGGGGVKGLQFDGSITYVNLFFIFALQKLWKCYYIAGGYDIADFALNVGVKGDPAHYEYLLLAFCCLENISIRLDGVSKSRIDKVAALTKYALSYRYLNVCWDINNNGLNCSNGCAKCMRTMLELDLLGELDKYNKIFDVKYFRENYHEYLAEYYRGCLHKDAFALELKPYMKQRSFPLSTYISAWFIIMKKVLKKLQRGWKIGHDRFSSKG